jgi:hypothetical protein
VVGGDRGLTVRNMMTFAGETEENEELRKVGVPYKIRAQTVRIQGKNITAYTNSLQISLTRRIALHDLSYVITTLIF